MSVDRRSFYGIAEAWVARGDGKQKLLPRSAKILDVFCDISFVGNVNPLLILAETCEINKGDAKHFFDVDVTCSIATLNSDVDGTHSFNTFCFVVVTDPIPP
jgi:hypothetical protein